MAAIQRFPATRTVDNGAVLTLELLQNPATGEKIVDVVQVASWPLTAESMKAASSKALEVMRLVVRADTAMARGNGDLAIATYLKAIALQPEDSTLHNKLGICYQRTGKLDKAREQYEEAVRLNPAYASAWNNLATVHHTQGRHAKAVSYYKKAIEKRSDFAAAWRNLGAVELARGNVSQGLSAYREALRLDPSALETANASGVAVAGLPVGLQYFYFAKLTAANGQVASAIEFLEKAREGGFRDFDRVRRDPDFAAIIKDPRYKAIEEAIR
jgi:tetratricopeptide (TPR) repeat protein